MFFRGVYDYNQLLCIKKTVVFVTLRYLKGWLPRAECENRNERGRDTSAIVRRWPWRRQPLAGETWRLEYVQ